jgi:hypothetical protein
MGSVKTIGLLMLLAVSPAMAHAATVTVRSDDLLLPYSDGPRTGAFDVYVRVQGDDTPQVWGQSVRLELLDTGGGLTLSSMEPTPSTGLHPYLLPDGDFQGNTDGATAEAADFLLTGSVPLTDGAGLARIAFSIAGSTTGEFHFAFDPNETDGTFLAEDPEGYVPLTLRAGTIRVMPLGWIPMPGDANGDERVDDADASILASHWQQSDGATWADGDFNEDGEVNDADTAILAAHWQPAESRATPAPEPGTLVLLAPAVLGMFWFRRVMSHGRG